MRHPLRGVHQNKHCWYIYGKDVCIKLRISHNETWTKWMTFGKRHFAIHCLLWKLMFFNRDFCLYILYMYMHINPWFQFQYHWNLFPGVQLTISQHWSKLTASNWWQVLWTDDNLVYWRVFASFGLGESKCAFNWIVDNTPQIVNGWSWFRGFVTTRCKHTFTEYMCTSAPWPQHRENPHPHFQCWYIFSGATNLYSP